VDKKSGPIEIQAAGENGYYFTFALPYHKRFVSRFFTSPSEASLAANLMRSEVLVDSLMHKCISTTGGVYFVLNDSNDEPVGQSTIFDFVTHMEIAIEHLRKNFPFAPTLQLRGSRGTFTGKF